MVSPLASRDAEKLQAAGVTLTLAECVRLNALGILAERGGRQYQPYLLPRVAMVGGIVLREPTIGQQLWIDTVMSYADFSDTETELCASALAYSVSETKLPDAFDQDACKEAIEAFANRIKDKVTARVLASALLYVATGLDDTAEEFAPARNKDEIRIPIDAEVSISLGVLLDNVVLDLGLSLAEARSLTRSQLEKLRHDAIVAERVRNRIKLRDIEEQERKNYYRDYLRLFEEYKKRGKAANNGS